MAIQKVVDRNTGATNAAKIIKDAKNKGLKIFFSKDFFESKTLYMAWSGLTTAMKTNTKCFFDWKV